MVDKYESLRKSLRSELERIDTPLFPEVTQTINTELEGLCTDGVIAFGNDYSLSGFALECRVKEIFRKMGFEVTSGRDGMEDFVVQSPDGTSPATPLALEVKSSRKPHIARDELRQLDDWVFELSGEGQARKHGLGGGGGPDHLAFVSWGLLSRQSKPVFHPTPHKGILIFNGPRGLPFSQRTTDCIGANDTDFVDKRNFCIIPFHILLHYFAEYVKNTAVKGLFWSKLHCTAGILEDYDTKIFGAR